ncbi:MAG: hypothetical protein HXS48_25200 [Theionarchaea archaeon]|nr:hypothetical protein [Theionarchaea archaeon]
MKEMARYIKQALHKNQENAFLLGDRGIGKSSAASFLRYFAEKQENMLGIHIFLGGVSDLSDIVHHIFEQILKESKGQTWFENIRKFFGNYIKEIGLFGISVSFTPSREDLRELTRKFPEALHNVLKELEGQKSGLFIALDDINGLANKLEFANWYKSFVDEVATHYDKFPVFMILIGLPETRDTLLSQQPSLMRIFRIVEIERLSDGEVEEFFHKAFDKANMKAKNEAIDIMAKYSSGLPILMHEIGEAVFWMDQDSIIDEEDALVGVLTAAERIGKKYLDPKVYRAIRSKRYRSILRKLGQPISKCFTKKEIEKRLNESEKKVFHNFLRKLKDIGILEQDVEKGRGAYRFVNEIYPVYIWIESERAREPLFKDLNSHT